MRGLPRAVKASLEKAHDSAILAVEIYNKPAVKFKSGGYICLMVIAWTSLFHAIFFRKKTKPFYKKENGRYETIEGDYKYWELDKCLCQYFGTETQNPVRKNLEFFISMRNKVEHRSMPELDSNIFGECQAMLLNFDDLLETEFGEKYCIRESLSFSLQLFPSSRNLVEAVKKNSATKPVVEFIQQYRSTISPEINASGKYSFKAFLIQVSNHQTQNALPIQFVHYDKLTDQEKKHISQFVAMVKYKEIPIQNPGLMKPGEVVKKVQAGLGNLKVKRNGVEKDKFSVHIHTCCWQKYNVRPSSNSSNPVVTDSKYCVYDDLHNDYGYTQDWVDFLISKLRDKKEFDALRQYST